MIAYAQDQTAVDVEGRLERCGGQGDTPSGAVGAFLACCRNYEAGIFGDKSMPPRCMLFLTSIYASTLTREASHIAFAGHGWSFVTRVLLAAPLRLAAAMLPSIRICSTSSTNVRRSGRRERRQLRAHVGRL